jgi:hypothetical protein
MSEGMPPQPPPQPDPNAPPPAAAPQPAGEPFGDKMQRWFKMVMPPVDPANDTPEAKMNRMLIMLAIAGVAIFLVCGVLWMIISLFK